MTLIDRTFQSASSFRSKQRLVIMLACSIVLVLTLACFLTYSYLSFDMESRDRLGALGDIIGADVGAALAFGDDQAVTQSLTALRADPSVRQLFVLNTQGQISAYYRYLNTGPAADLQRELSILRYSLAHHLIDLSPEVERPIVRDGVRLGTIFIEQDERVIIRKVSAASAIGAFILLFALGISYLLANRFQRIITEPVTVMAAAMREVSRLKDYSKRVDPRGPDELIQLAVDFNGMLGEIEQRDAALQENENRWKFAVEGSGAGVWDWNLQSDEAKYSTLWREMLGFAEDDISPSKRAWITRIHHDDQPGAAEAMRACLDGETEFYVAEYRYRCRDESYRWILSRGMVVGSDAAGKPVRMIGTHTDITDRKEREKELLKIEKLESLGVLAGGIAHDFNNILTGIVGNISIAQLHVDASHRSFKPLADAEKASLRAGELALQLLTFARGGEPIKKVASLRHIVDESLSLVLHGSHVKGIVDIPDSLHAVEADAGQMSQVFNNLVINAVQAMPEGGTLTVAARNEQLDQKNAFSIPAGSYIRLTFADQGHGISDEDLARIFDPYFTTKPKGNGLGLASVYSIITRHGGHIGVNSVLEKGTTFTILLPSLGTANRGQQADCCTPAIGARAGGPVLVMDDDQSILDLASEMLENLGYRATTCENGAEAIDLYGKAMASGAIFSFVIMDLTIPGGMGGKAAAERILALDPKACLLVSSGYSNDPIMSDYRAYGFSGSVAKPYRISELSQVLSAVSRCES